MKLLKKYLAVLLILSLVILSTPNRAEAVSNPNYIVLYKTEVFRNLLETGDQLWYVRYDINYSVEPTELPESIFIVAIYDTGGTELLFSAPVYYYENGLASIYLSASQALTWNTAYKFGIVGSPTVFSPLVSGTNYKLATLSSSNYNEGSTLVTFILSEASTLETLTGLTLLNDSGTLNQTGSLFFLKAIPGLQNMAPDAFGSAESVPQPAGTNTSATYPDTIKSRRPASLQAALTDIGSLLNISADDAGLLLALIFAGLVGGVMFTSVHNPTIAIIAALFTIPISVFWTFITLTLWILIFIIIGTLMGLLFIMEKVT